MEYTNHQTEGAGKGWQRPLSCSELVVADDDDAAISIGLHSVMKTKYKTSLSLLTLKVNEYLQKDMNTYTGNSGE